MESNVVSLDARRIRLHLFRGKLGPHASQKDIELYNQVYDFWSTTWAKVMADIHSELQPAEEFFRQDRVLALIDESKPTPKVVAFLCLNQYNINTAVTAHAYLKQYDETFYAEMKAAGVTSLYSGQFITVNPEYSAKVTRVNYASIILGLLHKAYAEVAPAAAALVSLARSDNGSCNTALKAGWHTVGVPITMHHVPVSQITLIGPPGPHKGERINEAVEGFWKGRIEHESGYEQPAAYRRAA